VTAAGDGHVRIWSIDAILNSGDASYSKPKQLASLGYHSGTIHTVRFSPNGKYLASGADDKFVCIYVLDPSPPTSHAVFGTLYLDVIQRPYTNTTSQVLTSHLQWRIGNSSDV
jgi:protein HIRA/HIR1